MTLMSYSGPPKEAPERRRGIPLTDEPTRTTQPVYGYHLWGDVGGQYLDPSGYPWIRGSIRFLFSCYMSYGRVKFQAPHLLREGFCDGTCGSISSKTPELLVERFTRPLPPGVERDPAVGFPLSWDGLSTGLFGVLALTRKVVEHEFAYRTSEATVVGLVHHDEYSVLSTSDPELIRLVFADRHVSYRDFWDEIRQVPIGAATIPMEERRDMIISELRRLTPHATG